MFTEEKIHSTRVDASGAVFWIENTIVKKDGVEIASQKHSTTLYPGTDLANVPAQVVAIAYATWNPENVAVFSTDFIAKQNAERDKQAAAVAEVQAQKVALENALAELEAAKIALANAQAEANQTA
jgi:hypothetical protein